MKNILLWALLLTSSPAWSASVSVTAVKPSPVKKGEPFTVTYEVKAAPASASIGFFLEREKKADSLPGPEGAMAKLSQPVHDGSGEFRWDGKSFGCAPTDFPTICEHAVEPGRYRIRAEIYDKPDNYLMGLMKVYSDKDPKKIAEGKSAVFEVTGVVDTRAVKSSLRGAATRLLDDAFNYYSYSGTEIERYIEETSALSGPDGSGIYCQEFAYKLPFAGKVKACGPNSYSAEQVKTTGRPEVGPGQMAYAKALKMAEDLAGKPYLKRVRYRNQEDIPNHINSDKDPEATTYLGIHVQNWAYRSDGNYWIFNLQINKAGGSEKGPDRFSDFAQVRVGAQGPACLAAVSGKKNPGDLFRDSYECSGKKP